MKHVNGIDFNEEYGTAYMQYNGVMPEIANILLAEGFDVEIWLANQVGHIRVARQKPEDTFAKVSYETAEEPVASAADIAWMNENNIPLLKVAYPTGKYKMLFPLSYKTALPLTGRQWVPGQSDCYRLALDYYKSIGIDLPVVITPENYVMQSRSYQGQNLFLTNWQMSGFEQVMFPQVGDAIYMRIGGGAVEGPNHCGMLLEGGKFLHHFINRLSTVQDFGGIWKESAVMYLRHKSRM